MFEEGSSSITASGHLQDFHLDKFSADYEVLFESTFDGISIKGTSKNSQGHLVIAQEIEDIFQKYNDYAKDHGFKMRKQTKKCEKGNASSFGLNSNIVQFACAVGHTKVFEQHGGYRKTKWKNEVYLKGSARMIPCKVKVNFEKDPISDAWTRKGIFSGHNHEPDPTLLSNEIVYYTDEFVTSLGCRISAMDIINHLRMKFNREFDIPTLLHHISQRFDIMHKAENVEFAKELVKEYPKEVKDAVYDDYQVNILIFQSDKMKENLQRFGSHFMFIDNLFCKFQENYTYMLSGFNQDGEQQIFGVIMCQRTAESIKASLQKFLNISKCQPPENIVIDSDPYLLEACQIVFDSQIQFSQYHIMKRIKNIFKDSPYLEKAKDLVSTDLFLKYYLELTTEKLDPGMTYDQHNFLLFLYDTKHLWQGLYMKEALPLYGLNNRQRYKSNETFKKLIKTFNSQKCNPKNLLATLETLNGMRTYNIRVAVDKYWYKYYQQHIISLPVQVMNVKVVQLLQQPGIKSCKMAQFFIFQEYYESQRYRVQQIEAGKQYCVLPPQQMLISSNADAKNSQIAFQIDQIKSRHTQTMKHELIDEEEGEREIVTLIQERIQNPMIKCTCYFKDEYGGLPCRHKFKFMNEVGQVLGLDFNILVQGLSKFWHEAIQKQSQIPSIKTASNEQLLNPEYKIK